jgi:hypothetical protein
MVCVRGESKINICPLVAITFAGGGEIHAAQDFAACAPQGSDGTVVLIIGGPHDMRDRSAHLGRSPRAAMSRRARVSWSVATRAVVMVAPPGGGAGSRRRPQHISCGMAVWRRRGGRTVCCRFGRVGGGRGSSGRRRTSRCGSRQLSRRLWMMATAVDGTASIRGRL